MQSYRETILLLDNDEAGDKATAKLLARSSIFKDSRELYKDFKDINHWLIESGRSVKQQQQQQTRISFPKRQHRSGRRIH